MNETFWKIVKELLKAKKLTQEAVANAIDVKLRTFQDWVCYKRLPDTESAKKIANVLGVSLDYLLTGIVDVRLENEADVTLISNYHNIKPSHRMFLDDLAKQLATNENSCIIPPSDKDK